MSHSFQNVRDRLGSLLINIFEADLHFVDAAEPECPRIRDFIAEVVGKIQILNDEEYPAIEGGSSISGKILIESLETKKKNGFGFL